MEVPKLLIETLESMEWNIKEANHFLSRVKVTRNDALEAIKEFKRERDKLKEAINDYREEKNRFLNYKKDAEELKEFIQKIQDL